MARSHNTVITLIPYFFQRFRKEIVTLSVLGFFGSILGGIGVSAIIPLLSILTRAGEPPNDVVTELFARMLGWFRFSQGIAPLLIFIVVVFFFRAFLLFFFSYIRLKIRQEYRREMMEKVFSGLLGAQWGFLLHQKIGHLQNTLLRNIEMSSRFLETLGNIMLSGTNTLIYFIFALLISPTLTVSVVAVGVILWPFSRILLKKTRATELRLVEQDRHVLQYIAEHLLGAKTIKSTDAERAVSEQGGTYFRLWNALALKKYILLSISNIAIEPLNIVFLMAAFAFSYKMTGFRIETFAATMVLVQRLFSALQGLFGSWQAIQEQAPHVSHVIAFEKELGERKEPKKGGRQFRLLKEIRFSDVSLAYENSTKVLSNVTFTIKKGETVGIIGPSGAGKTSLADLLLMFFEPTAGIITIDGWNIHEFGISDWRRHVGYVSQDVFLLNDTIENNIRFYNSAITREQILDAAQKAHIYDFVASLKDGFRTVVGDRGVLLSGGQRQRIALARVLCRNPEILILDEATSALDNESEMMIQNAIRGLYGKVTVCIIAHRLSTVEDVDRLLVLDRGRIVEEGPPHVLLQNRDSYFYKMLHIK